MLSDSTLKQLTILAGYQILVLYFYFAFYHEILFWKKIILIKKVQKRIYQGAQNTTHQDVYKHYLSRYPKHTHQGVYKHHSSGCIQTLSIMVHTNTTHHGAHVHPLSWCIVNTNTTHPAPSLMESPVGNSRQTSVILNPEKSSFSLQDSRRHLYELCPYTHHIILKCYVWQVFETIVIIIIRKCLNEFMIP